MKQYELLYIIASSFTDEEMSQIEAKVAGILTKFQATVTSTKRLGKLRLTYPINNQRHGLYVMVLFTAEPANIAKIEGALRITNEVLRSLVTSREEDEDYEQKFDLIQFTEVNIETREERSRRQDRGDKPAAKPEEKVEGKEVVEDLEKKIDAALQEDKKIV